MKHRIVYSSPNGSTRHVAEVITLALCAFGGDSEVFDLGRQPDRQKLEAAFEPADFPVCLWIGSPVYVSHSVPPVTEFLTALSRPEEGYAVPFVTWGAVNSGVALYEMAQLLTRKGYTLLGGAKVLAVHSSLWRADQPLGAGHPDPADDAYVEKLVEAVRNKLAGTATAPLPLQTLDYQPALRKQEACNKSIALVKQLYPELAAATDKCLQCGECATNCPAQAITLDPYPRFSPACFLCLKCVRECPEQAILFDTAAMEAHIRTMAATVKETPSTQIFV